MPIPRKAIDRKTRERVWEREGPACSYCGRLAHHLDHIIPWSKSQDNSESNLVAACARCNSWAGSKAFSGFSEKKEFIQERIDYLKRNRMWDIGDRLESCLKMFRIDPDDAADKCGFSRFVFNDFILGLREIEKDDALKIRRGLNWPGFGIEIFG